MSKEINNKCNFLPCGMNFSPQSSLSQTNDVSNDIKKRKAADTNISDDDSHKTIKTESKQEVSIILQADSIQPNGYDLFLDDQNKVKVHPAFTKHLNKHQIEGMQFMFKCTIDSVEKLYKSEDDSSKGAILAHDMGLGKTFQVIAFLHTILNNVDIQRKIRCILIIVPYNVILNWTSEFEKWFDQCELFPNIRLFEMINAKTWNQRVKMLNEWEKSGGILLLTMTVFCRLVLNSAYYKEEKKNMMMTSPSSFEQKPESQSLQLLQNTIDHCLLFVTDMVFVDEGHLLKNEHSNFNKSLSLIHTLRRIILTGTPVQNNLNEYYVMVNFVKPNFLGSKEKFKRRFENPIKNGQHCDSTDYDVSVMKRRAHVLNKSLACCIHRCDYTVLPLMPKHEYVLSLKLTKIQEQLYQFYLKRKTNRNRNRGQNLFDDYNIMRNIWNHPELLKRYVERKFIRKNNETDPTMREFYNSFVEFDTGEVNFSSKFILMIEILKRCEQNSEKIVVFSQSLDTLDLIEHFLAKNLKWFRQKEYFRIDHKVKPARRMEMIKKFNNQDERSILMLISTKTGCLGINLVAANRCIIFDTSWNPSNDQQAIFRIYRTGQQKTVYVYRFIAFGTMEEKIYKRQITKQSLSNRVVDKKQIARHYSRTDLEALYTLDTDFVQHNLFTLPKDPLLKDIIMEQYSQQLLVNCHEHDSLLENKPEEDMSDLEKQAAWDNMRAYVDSTNEHENNNNCNQSETNPTILLNLSTQTKTTTDQTIQQQTYY